MVSETIVQGWAGGTGQREIREVEREGGGVEDFTKGINKGLQEYTSRVGKKLLDFMIE